MWNNDILSIIYTKVKIFATNRLKNKYPDITFTTSARVNKNAKFPTIILKKIQGSETGQTLEGQEVNGIISIIQIDVIDNVSQTRANDVADIVMSAMKNMRYQVVGDTVIDESDESTYRVVARYRRILGYDDML